MRTGDVFSRAAAGAGVAVSRTARFAFLLLAALVASSIFNEAFAESRDREDRLDLRSSIRESDQSSEQKNSATPSDPKLKTTSGEKKDEHKPDPNRYFQVEFTVPIAYTNRAVRPESDVGGSAKGDFYAFPDLLLKWSLQTEWVKLTASLDLGTDRYSHEFDANGNGAIWSAKAQWTDGKSDYFVPYAAYVATTLFDPDFRYVNLAVNDVIVGFSSSVGIDPKGRLVAFSDASGPGALSFTFDTRAGQRFSESTHSQFRFVQASLEAALTLTKELTIAVTPKVRVRWYDDYYGEFRRDIRAGGLVKLTWTPHWLTKVLPRSEFALALNMYRNFSNLQEENYLLWDVGPSLAMKWKF
jgi:hypothetical protein